MDTLKAWLDREGRKQKWLAAQLGVSSPVVSRWITGVVQPSLEQAAAIERVTHGQVPMSAWLKQSDAA